MAIDPQAFRSLFQEELAALDSFAAAREKERALPLGREDPDVRRLLEALAFFSARTRAAAAEETRAAIRRMAAGVLDDLLSPMPAAGLLQSVPDEGLVEPAVLPRGALLQAVTPQRKIALFTTDRALRILPITVEHAEIRLPRRGPVLEIRLRSRIALRSLDEISFHLRRLGDYHASLALFDAIDQHVERATVLFDPRGDDVEGDHERSCTIALGAPRPTLVEDEDTSPLGRIRAFFHAPDRDLFLSARLPAPDSPFRTAVLRLYLDEGWPEELGVSRDCFLPYVVPIRNAWTEPAEPILCDGTKEGYPIRSGAAPLEEVTLQAVRGVYRVGDGGMVPILPASLARRGDAWELDEDAGGGPRLRLDVAGAFEKPKKISVDAIWAQPGLWSSAPGKLEVRPRQRHLGGVGHRMVGGIRGPEGSPLAESPERVLDVLARRARPIDDVRDLAGLLELLGAAGRSPYRDLPGLLTDLGRREAPDATLGGGLKHVYTLSLRQRAPEDAPLLRRLVAQIGALLDAWTEHRVEIEAAIDAAPRALTAGGA